MRSIIYFLSVIILFLLYTDSIYNIKIKKNNPPLKDSLKVSENSLWSVRTADSFIYRHLDFNINYENKKGWNYEQGLMLQSLCQLYLKTNDERYFNYIIKNLERYIDNDGTIKTYVFSKFRLDDIAPGKVLLDVYKSTGKEKYKIAADTLRKQLKFQPRNSKGGFWHKEIYPYQMWLDGLYMAEPFYAKYAKMFNEELDFNDVANQFILSYKYMHDTATGLLYHGWDESKKQKWANLETGDSPEFWGRGMGWYEMALVDVLDFFPKENQKRKELINILQKTCESLLKYRDKKSGVWYQVLNKGNKEGNYLEASCSCMFTYAFAKGANKGYLDKKYYKIAEDSYKGILKNFIQVNDEGLVNILHTCSGAGLGGNPYRSGSFEYYINEPQRINDFKAIGPFILASIELNR